MGLILINDGTRIPASDAALDQAKDLIENGSSSRGGFWIAGQLEVQRDGEATHADPQYGHQRMWIPSSTLVSLIYDRPLHPDPDRVSDEPNTIYL